MSRTERVALSRARLIDTGLQLARHNGLEQVSIRRIAATLGVTPMAVYRHLPDWNSLQAAMLDRFIEQAAVLPTETLPWQDWMRFVAQRMHDALAAEPGWIALFGQIRLEHSALQVLDNGTAVLQRDGFPPERAVQALFALIQCVIGAVSLHASFQRQRHDKALPLAGITQEQYPVLAAVQQDFVSASLASRLTSSLEWLIQGLENERLVHVSH